MTANAAKFILACVSCAAPLLLRSRLLAVVILMAGPVLHADNPSATYTEKKVPLKSGGKNDYVVVRDVPDIPDKDTHSSHSSGFSGVSSMANKTFSGASFSGAKEDPSLDAHGQNTFQVKSFNTSAQTDHSLPKVDAAYPLPSAHTYGHTTTDLDKSFSTKQYEAGTDKTAPTLTSNNTEADQDRVASMGDRQSKTFDSTLPKQYLGPGAQQVPPGVKIKENVTLYSLNELPTRPLSIDEVRNLINHGFKPDTNKPPPPESKALDDPDYKPEPRPGPSEPIVDDDKNDPVPSPGTMAHPPEDSEPLPQH